jgi:hypothetical protein
MGTRSFLGVERPGMALTHTHLAPRLKKRVELYLYSPLWAFVAHSRANFTFYWICDINPCFVRFSLIFEIDVTEIS